MSVAQFKQNSYGLTQPLIPVFPAPIISNRAPTTADKAQLGTTWINKPADDYYVITNIVNNLANWQLLAAGTGALDQLTSSSGVAVAAAGNINVLQGSNILTTGAGSTITVATVQNPTFTGALSAASLTASTGNITATLGNIVASAGSVSAATTVTAGTGITATTGNIVASAGNINATLGSISANTTVTAGTSLVGTLGITISAFTAGAIVCNNSGVFSAIPGTAGEVLTSNGVGVAPSFQAAAAAPANVVLTATTPYVAAGSDYFIGSDCSGGVTTVQLPDAPATGKIFVVKDYTGNAAANNITVTTVGGVVLIDGAATYPLNTNYEAVQVIFNGTSYSVF